MRALDAASGDVLGELTVDQPAGLWPEDVAARDGAAAEIVAVRPPGAVLARVPLGRPATEAVVRGAWGPDSPWLGTAGAPLLGRLEALEVQAVARLT